MRDSGMRNYPPRWNGAPSQELLRHPTQSSDRSGVARPTSVGIDSIFVQGSDGRAPADQCESRDSRAAADLREAYRKRRCILPVDGFFDWKAIKGQRAKQPYAIAMKDGSPFGIAGIWENWKEPSSGQWIRTFAIITTDANALVANIHDRMPAILQRVPIIVVRTPNV